MWKPLKPPPIFFSGFILLLFVISQTTYADIYESVDDPTAQAFGNRVCTNEGCTMVAARYLNYADKKVNPCDDFPAYACGNYNYHHEVNVISEMWLTILNKLEAILKAPPSTEDKPWHTLSKTYYKKCMDGPAITATMKSDILALLADIGGWPLLNPQWKEFGSYEEYIADIHKKYDVPFLFRVGITPQASDSSKRQVDLEPQLITLDVTSMLEMAIKLGAAENPTLTAEIEKVSKDILLVHNQLLLNTKKSKAKNGPLDRLKEELPEFDLEKYITRLFDGVVSIKPDLHLKIRTIEYFKQIRTLFTNKRVFANYAAGNIVVNFFKQHLFNNEVSAARSRKCLLDVAEKVLIMPTTQMYVKKYYPDRAAISAKLTEMMVVIKEVLTEMINKADWLDDDTRKSALKKCTHMDYSFVHPKNLFDDALLIEKDLPASEASESFITLVARLQHNKVTALLARINKPKDSTEAWNNPLTANGFYAAFYNKFYFAAGVLEYPFLNRNVPDYITYATLGFVMSHEIMHGFDDEGARYDETGNLRVWWSRAAADKYEEKATCFINQYDKEGVSGLKSLGENIADNVGLKIAYHAYKKAMAKRGTPEPALPGFEHFTVEQMFFLSLANAWCTIPKVTGADASNDPDPHPHDLTRIKMTTTNLKEFSEAFSCPKNSPMNPDEKCYIW